MPWTKYTGVTVPDLLPTLKDLADSVRILATTRNDPEVLKFFQGISHLDLLTDAPQT